MLFLNFMVMFGDEYPIVVSICDCVDHMSEGERKISLTLLKFLRKNKMNLTL